MYSALGIMTGTSCDAIDLAHLETDGAARMVRKKFISVPFASDMQKDLLWLGTYAKQNGQAVLQEIQVQKIIKDYTLRIADTILQHFNPEELDLIGLHGQTILHRPKNGISLQIGLGQLLANQTGCQVVCDFRKADILAGGQGAPLIPLYHQALAKHLKLNHPIAFTNIGGVANVTYIDLQNNLIKGWDTGMGNGLIDFLCQKYFNCAYDENGNIAATGKVHEKLLTSLLKRPFFELDPPKSLDRNEFHIDVLKDLSPIDAVATATAFTAHSLVYSDKFFPKKPIFRIIAGGGVYNHTLMQMIKNLSDMPVFTAEEKGMDSNALEAECFAWLAVRAIKNFPLSLPSITGAKHETTGGVVYRPA